MFSKLSFKRFTPSNYTALFFGAFYIFVVASFKLHDASRSVYFDWFIGVLFVFASIHILIAWKPIRYRQAITINFAACFASFYLADAYVAFDNVMSSATYSSQNERIAIIKTAERLSIDYDPRTKHAYIQSKNNSYKPFVPLADLMPLNNETKLHEPQIFINASPVMPLNGIGGNYNIVVCNERGDWWTYPADRYGYNNPDNIWNLPRLDVAVVGDSYAHGSCLNGKKSFPDLIRTRYPATANLGWGSSGPLAYLGSIKEYLATKKPKVVIFAFFEGNDMVGMNDFKAIELLTNYLEPGYTQQLVKNNDELNGALNEFIKQQQDKIQTNQDAAIAASDEQISLKRQDSGPTFTELISRMFRPDEFLFLRRTINFPDNDRFKPDFRLLEAILIEAKREVASWGGEFVFLYLPAQRYIPGQAFNAVRSNVRKLVLGLGISVIDGISVFDRFGGDAKDFHDHRFSHMSEKGHKAIALAVTEYVEESFSKNAK